MTPEQRSLSLTSAARNAATTIRLVFDWLDVIEGSGGCVTIPGMAKTRAMIKDLNSTRSKIETLILKPIDDATNQKGIKS